ARTAALSEERGRLPVHAVRDRRAARLILRAHLDEARICLAYLKAWLRESRRSALHRAVLDAEDRAVPRTLDLATITADPLALVQRSAGMGAFVRDRVDRVIDLGNEDLCPLLRLSDHRLTIVKPLGGDVELLLLR